MAVTLDKRDGESNESAMRRFSRKFQSSGTARSTRARQFFTRKPNKRRLRDSAIHRSAAAKIYEYMVKIGKIDETEKKKKRHGKR